MSEAIAKVLIMRAQASAKAEEKRKLVRAELEEFGLADFVDEMKAEFGDDLKMTHLKTPRLELGETPTPGLDIGKMVIDAPSPRGTAVEQHSRTGRKR
jgi:hypothetical protein